MKFSLIIPLWNEGNNIYSLIKAIAESELIANGMAELILVNNGSSDETGRLVDEGARNYSWIVPVHLNTNENYGGGVYEGCKWAKTDILCYIPGDLQVMPDDVVSVYKAFCANTAQKNKLLTKGFRDVRHDSLQTQFVSYVYTFLANLILNLRIKDVNGLPKMFHRSLLDLVPLERMKTFVFDSQLISLARTNGWTVDEVKVTFYSRREGVSSWSRNRIKIYILVFRQLIRLRALRYQPGVILECCGRS
jgi:glycosyltransferase involved in cell wall biosynthesis